ncbi:F-box only protein 28 isoform X2 [Chiroxiphia lanceolata]|uniref:F-box only protein 28 isoform X2 n=12 Tax=Passeriformes TaxID=9126 RepID=A0A6J2I3V2_9PASS|nr:F-box only protein 28 isoform X2 [Pipra filicauda]XP_032539022.1 F-box only protein 28 isoform X2 [Chiroxiphia lanceolata]
MPGGAVGGGCGRDVTGGRPALPRGGRTGCKMAAPEERLVSEGEGGAPGSARLSPAPLPESAEALAPMEPPPQSNTLMGLPIVAIESILSFLSYDETSQLRLVCKRMDLVCQRMLNQGFLKVERYHNLCQKQVKAQLPRRESERRNHSLARHADILAAVETRLSLLNMTFMKYVDSNLCCFIPGKVIDEIYRVLRYVNSTRAPQRAHEVLQELRDISSMAMEYFDEKIVPILKRKMPGSDVSGRLIGTAPVPGPSAALTTMQLFSKQSPSRQEVTKLQQQVKANGTGLTALKREISELRIKVQEQQKQLQDQDQKLLEQTQIIGEQNARLAELERKLREVMESTVGNSSGSGSNEQSPRKRRKAVDSTDCPRKSKRLRNRK